MWFYKEEIFDNVLEEFDSFVYIIERLNYLEDSKSPIYYIGKKTFFNIGKYKNKKIKIESNWWEYYGSSEDLSSDIIKYGKHNFKRTILHLCRTKGDAGYLEAKEQINRNVLHIDKDNYKLYYNKNILGRYKYEPEFYLLENEVKEYFNLDTIHGNNHGKKWITDGKNNRLVSKSIADDLVSNNIWSYGKCEKHIEVNKNGENFLIPISSMNNSYNIGYIKKYVTNGVIDKLLPIHKIPEYIQVNPNFFIGYSKNNGSVWITNGVIDKKININDKDKYENYKFGRSICGVRNKISVVKDNIQKWITHDNLNKYLNDGWEKQSKNKGKYNLFIITDGLTQKHFRCESDKNIFLSENKNWRDGQLHRENFNTKDLVFAKDMRTDKKLKVTINEYKENKYLTTVKSKKVKIKSKNKIIFTGYLDLFLMENENLSKTVFMNYLRSNNKDIIFLQKGKNKHMNEMFLTIQYL